MQLPLSSAPARGEVIPRIPHVTGSRESASSPDLLTHEEYITTGDRRSSEVNTSSCRTDSAIVGAEGRGASASAANPTNRPAKMVKKSQTAMEARAEVEDCRKITEKSCVSASQSPR